jgi:hypothetical protein
MVKHIILWTLKEEFTAGEKAEIKAGIKAGLEVRSPACWRSKYIRRACPVPMRI